MSSKDEEIKSLREQLENAEAKLEAAIKPHKTGGLEFNDIEKLDTVHPIYKGNTLYAQERIEINQIKEHLENAEHAQSVDLDTKTGSEQLREIAEDHTQFGDLAASEHVVELDEKEIAKSAAEIKEGRGLRKELLDSKLTPEEKVELIEKYNTLEHKTKNHESHETSKKQNLSPEATVKQKAQYSQKHQQQLESLRKSIRERIELAERKPPDTPDIKR